MPKTKTFEIKFNADKLWVNWIDSKFDYPFFPMAKIGWCVFVYPLCGKQKFKFVYFKQDQKITKRINSPFGLK